MAPLAASSPSHSLVECVGLSLTGVPTHERRPWLADPRTLLTRGCIAT
jgi:hypothetical protein